VDPRITIIIPTYNWSEALRCSIASVLAQTFPDFELLVIGDACTDDSEQVVGSFGDPRIQWRNLSRRAGSQSGPNNHGLRLARGAYVAYLGHDDIWHPEHLASLLDTIERLNADVACAVSVMYGPPGSGIRGLSGVFIEGEYRKEDFFPPSSMMHSRSLIDRIGGWRAPESIAAPVDCEFLERAHGVGARIVSSGRLTVFKFNASWRRDSYRRRDTSEQRAMTERLNADASSCVEAELVGVLQAAREARMIEMRMPGESRAPAGHSFRVNTRFRGLTREEFPPLNQTRRFPADDQGAGLEWYPLEHSTRFGPIRWSGPSMSSTIALPIATPRRCHIRIRLLNLLKAPLAEEVRVLINDQVAAISFEQGPPPVATLSFVAVRESESATALRIRLEVSKLRSPYFHHLGESEDRRWLGVCLNWVEVEPLIG